MRQYLIMAAVVAAAAFAAPTAAMARPGFVTTNLNLRAGPSTSFPVVDTLPAGASVDIHGCLSGYTWCDVGWRGERGWVAGRYLDFEYRGRRVLLPEYGVEVGFPIVTFAVGSYWNHYYRHRHFYHRRHYFERHWRHRGRPHHRGRVGRPPHRPHLGHQGGHANVGHHGQHGSRPHARPNFITRYRNGRGGHISHRPGGHPGMHIGRGHRPGGGGGHPHMGGGGGGGHRGGGGGLPHMGGGGRAGGGGGGGPVHDY